VPSLEQIVRPSETTEIRPAYVTYGHGVPVVPDPNEIVWGTSGNDIFQLQANSKSEIKPGDEEETQRTFDTVRVKSKDDPDSYVDIEVMTAYQARNTIDKSRTTLRFQQPEAGDNTEIIKRGTIRKG